MKIVKGSTYRDTLRWASSEVVLKKIEAVEPTVPVRLRVPNHGLPDGWIVRVENHRAIPATEAFQVRVVDANVLELPKLNGFTFVNPQAAVLRYNKPVDLTGYAARMDIREEIGGALLASSEAADAPLNIIEIEIDVAECRITRTIPAAATTALAWATGVYDLEMVNGDYVVKIDGGSVTVEGEVTTQ